MITAKPLSIFPALQLHNHALNNTAATHCENNIYMLPGAVEAHHDYPQMMNETIALPNFHRRHLYLA